MTWRDDRAMEWIGGFGLCALAFALSELAGSLEDAHAARRLNFVIVVLVVGGVLSFLLERIRRLKLETRVKLAEFELRMAELAQAVAPPSPDAPTSRS